MKSLSFIAIALLCAGVAHAQAAPPKPDSTTKLTPITVTAKPDVTSAVTSAALPVTAAVAGETAKETVNLIDTEDAVKYLPSVFLRKRNNGDNQAVMGTRVWGVSSSARSLIFADGVPLSALIANNNSIGGPRWGLVSPEEIAHIDMMYGPYSAAYAGNSMGAVMEITTRLPDRFEGSINQTQALQTFDLYATKHTYGTTQTTAHLGDRFGTVAVWASGNYQDSHSQPLGYVTSATFPSGTTGGYAAQNKLGAPANVLGASGLLHSGMTNGKLKVAVDLTPAVRAAYTFGIWRNDTDAGVDPYTLRSGQPTYAGQPGFASGYFHLLQQHTAHSLTLRTDTKRAWDWEAVATRYSFGTDRQRTPTTASATDTTFASAGRVAVLNGTGWSTLDLKGMWRAGGTGEHAVHLVSFGMHSDAYTLLNTTFTTPNWQTGDSLSGVATEGDGKTRTEALWVQDRWRLTPSVRLTVGGRYEHWRAFDGYNVNGSSKVTQPVVTDSKFSPKAILSWTAAPMWAVTASVGQAFRFATASELYQLVSTGTTFTSPNPDLKPDDVLAAELRIERLFVRGRVQLALFQDDVHDAIISQFLPLVAGSPTLYSAVSNVDHVRARGAELVLGSYGLFARGLEFNGSATVLNARTLALSGQASATAAPGSAVGKRLPNIPDWRASFAATYRADDHLSLTLGGRYSAKVYTTLDNADVNPNTYQGFAAWFVADARANYRVDRHWTASLGADNVLNRKYFLFHPFPQRTFIGSVSYSF
jgi:iron complex outermembrane receptor protein